MSFSAKLIHVVQIAVLTVVSAVTVIALAGSTVYCGSRATDWALGLPRHTTIQWLGVHSHQIAQGANALANVAIATGIHGHQ